MTADLRLRTAGRALAADPSPEAQGALIRERLRAGDLSQERVELAAYCGHEGARFAIDPECGAFGLHNEWLTGALDLLAWLRGLSRWEGAQVRAAMAAARVALEVAAERAKFDGRPIERIHAELRAAGRAIEAAEAWAACPCEEHWNAWHEAFVNAGHLLWLPFPLFPGHLRSELRAAFEEERPAEGIAEAARLAGEPAVREAIQRALVEWTLGGGA